MFVHPRFTSVRALLPVVALSALLSGGGAFAQAPVTPSVRGAMAPDASEAVSSAYDTLDWTGRPATPQILRKEAGAALVEGRRSCARSNVANRKACLETVQADYQDMMARHKMRTASRR